MKSIPAWLEGSSKGKPTWTNTFGYWTTSAFFVLLVPMEGDTMIGIDNRISEKNAWPEVHWSHHKHRPPLTIGERIARAAHAFERRQTKHARKWTAVFMNEETIVIALHGSLTDAEKAHAQNAAGAAEVQEFHLQLFADASALLLQKIKSITGMNVCHISAEIDPTSGSVVHLFTTDSNWFAGRASDGGNCYRLKKSLRR